MSAERINGENVWKARFTHPARANSPGESPGRAVRYISRRAERGQAATREADWHTLPNEQMFGNSEKFKAEASRRAQAMRQKYEPGGDKAGKDLSRNKRADLNPELPAYYHVVLSPDTAHSQHYEPEDFAELLEPWVSEEDSYFAAVHYDEAERPHMHLLIARDYIPPGELEEKQNRTDEISAFLALDHGLELSADTRERIGLGVRDEAANEELERQGQERNREVTTEVETERTPDQDLGVEGKEERRRDDGLSL